MGSTATEISDVAKFLFVALGVALSVLIPVIWRAIRAAWGKAKRTAAADGRSAAAEWWVFARPYVLLAVGSLLTAFLVLAFTKDNVNDWEAALLAGYVWDSTLQKIATAQK